MKYLTLTTLVILSVITSFSQTITTIAGIHIAGYSGDGSPATAARLNNPGHIAFDNSGNIIVADWGNNVIRKINTAGIISTIGGTGVPGYSGDGFAATAAELNEPNILVTDQYGNIFFADEANSAIRRIDTNGIITTVAGTGTSGYSGDGMPATSALLNRPDGVAVDSAGNVYIADTWNHRIRKVNTSGIITTVAGTGVFGFSGDGGPATAAQVYFPVNLTTFAGNIYIADQFNLRIRKIDPSGTISTFAGNGTLGFSGDGGPATAAELYYPSNIAVRNPSETGGIYITDSYNNRIRLVDGAGIISTIAGNGTAGYAGDGSPATDAELNQPWGANFDLCGNLLIGDAFNNVIRKVEYFAGMPTITGPGTVAIGATAVFTISIPGGTWTSSNPGIATINATTGVATGVTAGSDTIRYNSTCGVATLVISVVSATALGQATKGNFISLSPNPNSGSFTIKADMRGITSATDGKLQIIDLLGTVVYDNRIPIVNGFIDNAVTLNGSLANGIYYVKILTDDLSTTTQFSLTR